MNSQLTKKRRATGGNGAGRPLPEPLNGLIEAAVREEATDIHIDTTGEEVLIRFRVDGAIHEKHSMSKDLGQRLLNQIKVASDLEPERTFGPLESQLKWRNGGEKRDIRVGIIPSGSTEAFHLRLLTIPEQVVDIHGLAFSETDLEKVSETIRHRQGLMLISGPTGAGKTITLYSLASSLDLRSTVAVSIEDPIEFDMPFMRQVQVNDNQGLSMAESLRMFLRMDPDVIMIGEIRDKESAVTAARAALSGRLVIATVHAADAASAIEGLHYMSVPYYIIGGSLRLVMTQTLVRHLCPACAEPRPLNDSERTMFKKSPIEVPDAVFLPKGCQECNHYGYRGRVGVYEVVGIDEETNRKISSGASQRELRQYFRSRSIRTSLADALEKVAKGITSMEEILQFYWPGSKEVAE